MFKCYGRLNINKQLLHSQKFLKKVLYLFKYTETINHAIEMDNGAVNNQS